MERDAAGLVEAKAGLRLYQLQTAFLEKHPHVSRRTAGAYLSRARDALRAECSERIRALADSLPGTLRAVIDHAMAEGDGRTVCRALRLVADVSQPMEPEAPCSPGRVVFEIVETDPAASVNGVSAGGYAAPCPDLITAGPDGGGD